MPREFTRNQRHGDEVLRSLSELLRFETKDPRLEGVSLTAVELTRDLSVARVYYSMLDHECRCGSVPEAAWRRRAVSCAARRSWDKRLRSRRALNC